MRLVSVYRVKEAASILYELLKCRPPEANISHRQMPTFRQHQRFVRSVPYNAWHLIQVGDDWAGAIYLSRANEIGVFLFPPYRGSKLAPEAIRQLMVKHPRERYLANISPTNPASLWMFRRLGFLPLQHTYEYRP